MDELKNAVKKLFINGYSKRTVIKMINDIWRDLMWRDNDER